MRGLVIARLVTHVLVLIGIVAFFASVPGLLLGVLSGLLRVDLIVKACGLNATQCMGLAGFWVVMAVGIALALVYAVGAKKGKRAAQMWTDVCVAALALGAVGVIAWALASGQLRSFLVQFGYGPLFEMLVLAALFIGSMWFMAVRYTQGLKE